MARLLEVTEQRGVEFKKMKESMERMEETIITLKRKNAGANAREGLMAKMTGNTNQPSGGGD